MSSTLVDTHPGRSSGGRLVLAVLAVLVVVVLVIIGTFTALILGVLASASGAACAPAAGAGTSATPGGSGTTIAGQTWSAAQVSNIKVVIGVAKTMFGDQAQQAAVIGLMVADTESGFRNYANDGEIGPEDAGADTSRYGELTYSLSLPHDAVGTDHSSVGLVQQQATYSWGAFGDSTWSTDPEGVIQRLMTPAFAIGRFYVAMSTSYPDWANMDPAQVAQNVQVSGPNAYARSEQLARDLWDALGAQAPAVTPPAGTGWSGPSDQQAAAVCQPQGAVTGDKKQLAESILANPKITLYGAPGDRANPRGQVEMIAAGTPGCNINMGILQLIVVAANARDHITVSSLNRNNTCTGQNTTTFAGSYHSLEGGGHAVDFTADGINGYPGPSTDLLAVLKPYLPPRADGDPYFTWIGQENCRGYALNWPGIYEGDDTCSHQHINISPKYNDTGLPAFATTTAGNR